MALKLNTNLPVVRHYDKIVAVLVLVLLAVSLYYLTSAGAERRRSETAFEGELSRRKPQAAVMPAMDMGEYEDALKQIRTPFQLPPSDDAQRAGFLTPERRVACVSGPCQKPIPFEAAVCPFCEAPQPALVKAPQGDGIDTDRDGIPDKLENALGLNPQDPSDAKGDLDGDGFTNVEEYQAKTDPKDAKSHPSIVNLLRVKELRGKRLPLVFSAVNTMPDGNQLVFNLAGPNPRTFWVREGQPIGETDYVAGRATVKFEERPNPLTPGIPMKVDVSTTTVKRKSDGKELTLKVNERGMVTDIEAVFTLPLDGTEVSALEGGTFKLREETYRVESVDNTKTEAVIRNVKTDETKVVRKLD